MLVVVTEVGVCKAITLQNSTDISRGEEQEMPLQVGTLHVQGGDAF